MCPCKDCLDRKLSCHSSCPRYLEWKGSISKPKEDEHLGYLKDKKTKAIRKAINNGKRKY